MAWQNMVNSNMPPGYTSRAPCGTLGRKMVAPEFKIIMGVETGEKRAVSYTREQKSLGVLPILLAQAPSSNHALLICNPRQVRDQMRPGVCPRTFARRYSRPLWRLCGGGVLGCCRFGGSSGHSFWTSPQALKADMLL